MDTGPIINLADDQNAAIIMVASFASQGLLLLFYIMIETLPFKSVSVGNPRSNVSIISGPHLFPNPGWVYPKSKAFDRSRKPLAAEFTMKGLNQSLFVIANHLKSKVEDLPLYGEVQPPRLVTANKRHTQAQIVKSFVDELLNVDPSANLVVLGDLNDFQFSETLHILKGNLLFNPLENLPIGEQYNYNFEGNSQAIDHILISKNLLNMSPELDVVHINSDFANKTSDHDPVALKIRVPMAYNQKLT
jgi:predicted extracellular nuclease